MTTYAAQCPNCRRVGVGLVGHLVTFNDPPYHGRQPRTGCVVLWRYDLNISEYKIHLFAGGMVWAESYEFTVDRLQCLVNYPDMYGRKSGDLCKGEIPIAAARGE